MNRFSFIPAVLRQGLLRGAALPVSVAATLAATMVLAASVFGAPAAHAQATVSFTGNPAAETPVALEVPVVFETSEGSTVTLTVIADPPPSNPLTVNYSFGVDNAPATDDADASDYSDRGGGSVMIAANKSTAGISISVTDDGLREADRETFTVTLTAADFGYSVASTGTALVVIKQGVCDRTRQVRDAIVAALGDRSHCSDVTDADLIRVGGDRIEFRSRVQHGLSLRSHSITSLREQDFLGLSHIEALHLGGNRLSTLPASVFSPLVNLEMLLLPGNRLNTLPASVFSGLGNLNYLDLDGNDLSKLPADVFSGLAGLLVLDLGDNGLSALPASVFSGLAELRWLNLFNNRLQSLPERIFSNLGELTTLTLDDNTGLGSLPPGIFSGLGKLQVLQLRNVGLTELPPDVFSSLVNLRTLVLQDNRLRALPQGIFSNLGNLTYLNLVNNQLQELPARLFSGLPRLDLLYLGFNPGTPFIVTPQLRRVATPSPTMPGVVEAKVTVRESLPRSISVELLARGGELSADTVDLSKTSTESRSLTVTQTAAPPVAVIGFTKNAQDSPRVLDGVQVASVFRSFIDVVGPSVSGVRIISSPANGNAYLAPDGEVIRVAVGFDEPVTVTTTSGDPTLNLGLALEIGDEPRTASYDPALSGASTWVFSYALQAADLDDDGVSVGAGALSLGGAQITDVSEDRNPITSMNLSAHAIADAAGHEVGSRSLSLSFEPIEVAVAAGGTTQVELVLENAGALTSGETLSVVLTPTPGIELLTASPVTMNAGALSRVTISLRLSASSAVPVETLTASASLAGATVAAATLRVRNFMNVSFDFSDESVFEAREGAAVQLTVVAYPAPSADLTLQYRFGPDDDPATADADSADYSDPGGGSVVIAANETTAVFEIAVTDDDLIEPTNGEALAVSLTSAPGYFITSAGTAVLTFKEGVCDRTGQVRDVIVAALGNRLHCADVTDADLNRIGRDDVRYSLNLSNRSITSLQGRDFLGLTNVDRIDLEENDLSTLPASIFAPLAGLRGLTLKDNRLNTLPGSVFSGLDRLDVLNLDGNALSELPAGIFSSLGNLLFLHISDNQLTALPSNTFSGLPLLEELSMNAALDTSDDGVNELPADLFLPLGNLRELSLNGNGLRELPAGMFSHLVLLEDLNFCNNQLIGLPAGVFAGLVRLKDFCISNDSTDASTDFILTPRLQRVGSGPPATPGVFEARLVIVEGAPSTVTADLSPQGGTLSLGRVTVPQGSTVSDTLTVTQDASPPVIVSGTLPELPRFANPDIPGYTGLQITRDFQSAVDVISPLLSGVEIISNPASGDAYLGYLGEMIHVGVVFNEPVTATTINGGPTLAVEIGTAPKIARYNPALSRDSMLMFSVALETGDSDDDGISVGENALSLNGAQITDLAGNPLADAGLAGYMITNDSDHKVIGSDAIAPSVSDVKIISGPRPGNNDAYLAQNREVIRIGVGFDEPVMVTTTGGVPTLTIEIGTEPRIAHYNSELSLASTPVFAYTLDAADRDDDGISVGENALSLNGAQIADLAGNPLAGASLAGHEITNDPRHKVMGADIVAPSVSEVKIISRPRPGNDDAYLAQNREVIRIGVGFDEPVRVTTTDGAPTLAIEIGTESRIAHYTSELSLASTPVFAYTLDAADRDDDGISVGTDALSLNGAQIADLAGNPLAGASLAGHEITNDPGHKVTGDTTAPSVSDVEIISAPATGDTYAGFDGEVIRIAVGFDEEVTATTTNGGPTLAVEIGTVPRTARYDPMRSLASQLVFSVALEADDRDDDGISVGENALSLNGAQITDLDGNPPADVSLAGYAITNDPGHKVIGRQFVVQFDPPVAYLDSNQVTVEVVLEGAEALRAGEEVAVVLQRSVGIGLPDPWFWTFRAGGNSRRTVTIPIVVPLEQVNSLMFVSLGTDEENLPTENARIVLGERLRFRLAPTVSFDVPPESVLELPEGASTELRVVVNPPPTDDLTVNFRITGDDDPATADADAADYSAPGSVMTAEGRSVVIAAGKSTAAITVAVTDDDLAEPPRESFMVELIPGPGYALASPTTVPLVIKEGVCDHAEAVRDAILERLGTTDCADVTDEDLSGTTAPSVSEVEIISEPATGDTYVGFDGEVIRIAVGFDEEVTATTTNGGPTLTVEIGTVPRTARYDPMRSLASQLVFSVALEADDRDDDGISVGENALSLNGAQITDLDGNPPADVSLAGHAITNDPGHKVIGRQFVVRFDPPVAYLDSNQVTVEVVLEGAEALRAGEEVGVLLQRSSGIGLPDPWFWAFRAGENSRRTVTITVVVPLEQVESGMYVSLRTRGENLPTENARIVLGERLRFRLPVTASLDLPPESVLELPEGATTELPVVVSEPPSDDLTVHYRITSDDNPATVDADAADYSAPGSVIIAAGESATVITVAVTDDDLAEPLRESFIVELIPGLGYALASATTARLVIKEGVCDRTEAVRDAILGQLSARSGCADVTGEDLSGITSALSLQGRSLTSLKARDFTGLTSLRTLDLRDNGLQTLPAGVFAGLESLSQLYLAGNPGTFVLTPRLRRVGSPSPGVTEMKLTLDEGAPVSVSANLSAQGGTLSAATATIPPGGVESPVLTVTQAAGPAAVVTGVASAGLPGSEYSGFSVGGSFRLTTDALGPSVAGVEIISRPAGGSYLAPAGETIHVAIEFDEPVTVTTTDGGPILERAPSPTLTIQFGPGSTPTATYSPDLSAESTLVFSYVLQAGDLDDDGVSVTDDIGSRSGALALNGTRITDVSALRNPIANTSLGAHAITNAAGHRIVGRGFELSFDPPEVIIAAGETAQVELVLGNASALTGGETLSVVLTPTAGIELLTASPVTMGAGALSRAPVSLRLSASAESTVEGLSASATLPDARVVGAQLRVRDVGSISIELSVGFSGDLAVETREGGTVRLTVATDPAPPFALSVGYRFGLDNDPATADADSADYSDPSGGSGGGSVVIAAGETTAVLEIAITDDDLIEPTSESFTVSLTSDSAYSIVASSEVASVVIREGVCDRTAGVRNAITGLLGAPGARPHCADVSDADLSGISGVLSLQNLFLTSLRQGDFQGLVNVQTLELDINDLSALPAGVFSGLAGLQMLSMTFNDLTTLSANAFSGLAGLQSLNLQFNDLSTLPADVFSDLTGLQTLNLRNNRLAALPEEVFSGLANLQTLNLDGNRLSELPAGVFSGLTTLETLYLQSNRLLPFPQGIFSNLGELRTLNLRHSTMLGSLSADLFSGLGQLTELDLGDMRLSALPQEIFSGLAGLQRLSLDRNEFAELPAGVFSGLAGLQQLSLAHNAFQALPAGIFSGLSGLTNLSLNDNPGADFVLTPRLRRVGAPSPGVVEAKLTIDEGTPVDLSIALSAQGGELSTATSEIPAGGTESLTLTVTQTARPSVVVSGDVTLGGPLLHPGLRFADDFSAVVDVVGPSVADVRILSRPARGDTYLSLDGETIRVAVTFDEPVLVTTTGGAPTLTIEIGDAAETADYDPALSDVSTLVFSYVLETGDDDADGISVGENALALNGAQITDLAVPANPLTEVSLGAHAILNAEGHKVVASVGTLSFEPSSLTGDLVFEVREGEMVRLTVVADPAPDSALSVGYRFGADDDAASPDADVKAEHADYSDPGGGSVVIAAGETTAMIEITITDDELAEPTSESFTVSLTSVGGYSVESAATALIVIREGICDRTEKVRNAITDMLGAPGARPDCVDVTGEDLSAITTELSLENSSPTSLRAGDFLGLVNLQTLNLRNTMLQALPAGVFSALSSLRILDLREHQLQALPAGVFSGLVSLRQLRLRVKDNLTVFDLTPRAELEAAPQLGATRARFVVEEGAPVNILVNLSVQGGALSARTALIPRGNTRSEAFNVIQASGAPAVVTGEVVASLPFPHFSGFRVAREVRFVADRLGPLVAEVRIISKPARGNAYRAPNGEIIRVAVRFDEPATVTATGGSTPSSTPSPTPSPTLAIEIGDMTRTAIYDPVFSDASTWVFSYALQTDDLDDDGISVRADALSLIGAQITDTSDERNPIPNTNLGHHAIINAEGHAVGSRSLSASFEPDEVAIFAGQTTQVELVLGNAEELNPGETLSVVVTPSAGVELLTPSPVTMNGDTSNRVTVSLRLLSSASGAGETITASATLPGTRFTGAALRVQRIADASVGFSGESIVEVREGNVLELTVTADSALDSALTIGYRFGFDGNPATSDADTADYSDPGGGSVVIAAGATAATIEIPISDDDRVEPTNELFVVLLTPGIGYSISLSGGVLVVISEGVCDRTREIRDAITSALSTSDGEPHCADVTDADLSLVSRGAIEIGGEEKRGLSLRGRSLSSLQEGDFLGFADLQVLNLGDNDLSVLPPGVFSGLSGLQELYLDMNGLSTLSAVVFSGLDDLQTLDLRFNDLSTLSANVFSELADLESLDLSHNDLSLLSADAFSGLAGLQSLNLGSNTLRVLPEGIFSGLADLRELYLGFNQLSALPAGVFSALGSLQVLNLRDNDLAELPPEVFSGLSSLSGLELHENPEAPFILTLELQYAATASPGAAEVKLAVAEGAPSTIIAGLEIGGGTSSDDRMVIPRGSTESSILTAAQTAGGPAVVDAIPVALPPGYSGIETPGNVRLVFDFVGPSVSGVEIVSAPASGAAYLSADGEVIRVVVVFDEPVTLTATGGGPTPSPAPNPTLAIEIGDMTRTADYEPMLSGASTWVFSYMLQADDLDDDGISVGVGALSLSGAQITDLAVPANPLTDTSLGAHAITDAAGHAVGSRSLSVSFEPGEVAIFAGQTAQVELVLGDLDSLNPGETLNVVLTPSAGVELLTVSPVTMGAGAMSRAPVSLRLLPSASGAGETITASATLPGTRFTGAELRVQRIAGASVGFSGEAVVEVREGDVLELSVTADPPPDSALSVNYRFGPDGDAATSDADDEDYADSGGGSVTIAAGETAATIEIPITDDDRIEPTSESFTVSLTPGVRHSVTSSGAVLVVIREGVCDRTREIRDAITSALSTSDGRPHCADVTDADLRRVSRGTIEIGGEEKRGLSLRGLSLSSLQESDFLGLVDMQVLNLGDNDLSVLPPGAFSGLTGLQELYLDLNDLSTLSTSVFSGLAGLRTLDLNFNDLSTLSASVFSELASLEKLDLSRNHLSLLFADAFSGLANLQTLDLSFNVALSTLPATVFSELAALQSLNLSDNTLRDLPADLFSGSSGLQVLSLAINALQELPEGIFSGLADLRELDLSFNELSALPAGVFSALGGLQNLDLRNNSLAELPPDVFSGLAGLQELYLWANGLAGLPEGVFSDLSDLEVLDLDGNELNELPPGVFSALGNLQRLTLSNNQLEALPAGVFAGLSSLSGLRLEDNPGAPFTLTVELQYTAAASPGVVEVKLVVAEGAPSTITAGLEVGGEVLSASRVMVPRGGTESSIFTATQVASGPAVVVDATLTALPLTYFGIQTPGNVRLAFDIIGPSVSGAEIVSAPASGAAYFSPAGEVIRVAIRFDEPVLVTTTGGVPTLTLAIGDESRDAAYTPERSAADVLVFSYTLQAGDEGGVSVGADALSLNGAQITDVSAERNPLRDVGLSAHAIAANANQVVVSEADELSFEANAAGGGFTFEAEEGGMVNLTVTVASPQASDLLVRYHVGADNDAATADADSADYSDSDGGSVTIPANGTSAVIELDIVNDTDAEPARESFTVSLITSATSGGAVTVVIREGVCDRTDEVQEEILGKLGRSATAPCADVTDVELGGIGGSLPLNNYFLSAFKDGDFLGLGSLRILLLNGNLLRSLTPGVFQGLGGLEELDIGESLLTVLPPGVFSHLGNLRTLELVDNNINELSTASFSGLDRLQELNLEGNDLTTPAPGVFSALGDLRTLRLGGNERLALSAETFTGLDNLRTLSLEGIGMTSLPQRAFAGLGSLESLLLGFNRLAALPPGVFSGLTGLRELDLSNNAVASFPLSLELRRVSEVGATPVEVRLAVAEGAPSTITADLSVQGGELSIARATIPRGSTESVTLTVSQPTAAPVTVNGVVGGLPAAYLGVELPAAVRFALDDVTPTMTSVAIISSPARDGAYLAPAGETIRVAIAFDEPVTVTATHDGSISTPALVLSIGGATRTVSYDAGLSDASRWVFGYVLQTGDRDDDGVSVGADALSLGGAQITDLSEGRNPIADASLGARAIINAAGHRVVGRELSLSFAPAQVEIDPREVRLEDGDTTEIGVVLVLEGAEMLQAAETLDVSLTATAGIGLLRDGVELPSPAMVTMDGGASSRVSVSLRITGPIRRLEESVTAQAPQVPDARFIERVRVLPVSALASGVQLRVRVFLEGALE